MTPDHPATARAVTDEATGRTIRGARWAEGRPYAPLLVCAVLAGVQMVSWPVLFLVAVGVRRNATALSLLGIGSALWLLLPIGALYGLYIGFAQNVRRQGGWLPVAGIAANVVYLLFGLLTWAAALAGPRV